MLRNSPYTSGCENRTIEPMEQIDREWLKDRLAGDRGEQARLSRETGISPDKISKILSGKRQVQSSEAPVIYGFFYPQETGPLTQDQLEILSLWQKLSEVEREFLKKTAKGLLA